MIINKNKPENWGGQHVLHCRHCVGENRCRHYFMYCDVIGKVTPTGRIKVRVYGERWHSTKGSKIRYVSVNRIKNYK